MEWLGAMFKGIGDTFTAGSNVNVAKMNERTALRQQQLEQDYLTTLGQQGRLGFIMNDSQQEAKIINTVVIGAVIIVAIIIYVKLRKKR